MVRAAIRNFEKMDLKPTIYREAVSSFTNRGNSKRGCYSVSPNKQYDYDHKSDRAFYLDKAFVERRLETLKTAYEAHKEQAYGHAGPAVIEVFGEAPFAPVNKKRGKAVFGKNRISSMFTMLPSPGRSQTSILRARAQLLRSLRTRSHRSEINLKRSLPRQ